MRGYKNRIGTAITIILLFVLLSGCAETRGQPESISDVSAEPISTGITDVSTSELPQNEPSETGTYFIYPITYQESYPMIWEPLPPPNYDMINEKLKPYETQYGFTRTVYTRTDGSMQEAHDGFAPFYDQFMYITINGVDYDLGYMQQGPLPDDQSVFNEGPDFSFTTTVDGKALTIFQYSSRVRSCYFTIIDSVPYLIFENTGCFTIEAFPSDLDGDGVHMESLEYLRSLAEDADSYIHKWDFENKIILRCSLKELIGVDWIYPYQTYNRDGTYISSLTKLYLFTTGNELFILTNGFIFPMTLITPQTTIHEFKDFMIAGNED